LIDAAIKLETVNEDLEDDSMSVEIILMKVRMEKLLEKDGKLTYRRRLAVAGRNSDDRSLGDDAFGAVKRNESWIESSSSYPWRARECNEKQWVVWVWRKWRMWY